MFAETYQLKLWISRLSYVAMILFQRIIPNPELVFMKLWHWGYHIYQNPNIREDSELFGKIRTTGL
jgi:hypothetical protein